ncbi:MAG: hypothetical protein JXL67_12310, partial [Calditrichaeota bacterium]|nr:hypothetical protein [Calditrichota bacterium]
MNDISAAAPEEMGIAPPGDTSRYDSIQIRTQEMLYRETVLSDNPQKYLEFLYRYPDTYFGGLISCRYILLELNRGAQVPVLVHNLNEIGVDAHIMNLYPMIRGKPESLTRAIVFPQARIRMLLRQNYAGQLNKDPLVELYLDYYRTIRIPFDALHLMARKRYFRIESEEIQFIIADSSGLKLAQHVHNQLNFIMNDLSRKLKYHSAADATSELFDRNYLLQKKLTVFVYNPDTFIEMYQLHSAGWDYPFQGMIHITPD